MNKKIRVIIPVILIILLAVIGCQTETEPPDENGPVDENGHPDVVEGIQVGNLAPDFELRDLEGQIVSLSDFRGQAVLVNFWATWCPPCRAEMPHLQQVNEEWSGKGLMMLAINIGESKSEAETFLETQGFSLPVLLDADSSVARRYNIAAIPTTFFIDKDGIIQEKVVGAFPDVAEIEKRLVKIMP